MAASGDSYRPAAIFFCFFVGRFSFDSIFFFHCPDGFAIRAFLLNWSIRWLIFFQSLLLISLVVQCALAFTISHLLRNHGCWVFPAPRVFCSSVNSWELATGHNPSTIVSTLLTFCPASATQFWPFWNLNFVSEIYMHFMNEPVF